MIKIGSSLKLKHQSHNMTTMNPVSILRYLGDMPDRLKERIYTTKDKGVVTNMLKWAFATPHGVKANCYAYFLSPNASEWTDRKSKTQPGDMCSRPEAKAPLNFSNRRQASKQLIERIECDNPGVVFPIRPPLGGYSSDIMQMKLPNGYVLGCCICGADDYHFLRRDGIDEILGDEKWRQVWRMQNAMGVQRQLKALKEKGHDYCWSHVAGWSGRVKLVDANSRVIVNPVPISSIQPIVKNISKHRANHKYGSLHYDTFVCFAVVKARSAKLSDQNKLPRNVKQSIKKLKSLGIVLPG